MTARWFVRPVFYALLILFSLFFLMPVYVMLVTSLKPLSEVTLEKNVGAAVNTRFFKLSNRI